MVDPNTCSLGTVRQAVTKFDALYPAELRRFFYEPPERPELQRTVSRDMVTTLTNFDTAQELTIDTQLCLYRVTPTKTEYACVNLYKNHDTHLQIRGAGELGLDRGSFHKTASLVGQYLLSLTAVDNFNTAHLPDDMLLSDAYGQYSERDSDFNDVIERTAKAAFLINQLRSFSDSYNVICVGASEDSSELRKFIDLEAN